jgi:hypothetical protein
LNLRFVFCGVGLVVTLGCGGAADIPETPDLRTLISNYDAPDGDLDATRVAAVLAAAPPMPELAAGLRSTGLIASHVDDVSTDTAPSSGRGVRLQGSVKVEVRCPGELDNPDYDPAVNGTATLTLAVADTRIRRTFGGHADACVLKGSIAGQPARIRLDGNIAFDLGRDVGVGQRWSGRLLAYLPGELEVGGYTFRSVSARFTDDQLEHLIELDDGKFVILTLNASGLGLRDKNGTWVCPTGQTTCTRG